MKQPGHDTGFDQYRRERKMRQAQTGQTQRPIPKGQEVLREIEAAEQREIQQQRLTQDVHDFFADATRTAAQIVQKVSNDHAEQSGNRLTNEVEEFLMDAIRRAQGFIQILQFYSGPEAERTLQAQMHNLLGPVLDSFRNEGTAQVADKHIGLDPFAVSLEEIADEAAQRSAAGTTTDEPDPIEEHLVAEVAPPPAPAPVLETPATRAAAHAASQSPTANPLVAALLEDPAKLKEGLKALVRAGVLTRDQALEIYRSHPQK
jgi:hypothetical protein